MPDRKYTRFGQSPPGPPDTYHECKMCDQLMLSVYISPDTQLCPDCEDKLQEMEEEED